MCDMEPEIEEVLALEDPAERARRFHRMVSRLQELTGEASRGRREAIEELLASPKTTQADVARMLGVTRSRVSRLLSSAPNIERALLGSGPITIAVGGKREGEKAESKASIVASNEAMEAFGILSRMCTDFDLGLARPNPEIVPPPGLVELNRDNLIVLTSPRLLPFVGQILESDKHFGFRPSDQGWYLVDHDTGTNYRSPSDSEKPADFGYIGRLPRPDGKGTFLYMAGIHAMGTWGTAHFLQHNIADIYKEAKLSRWSVLIRCDYDPDTKQIIATEAITPIHVVR